MKNITVTVTAETLRKARIWSAQHNTSLSKVVQQFLTDLPNLNARRRFPTPETDAQLRAQLAPLPPEEAAPLSLAPNRPSPTDFQTAVKP